MKREERAAKLAKTKLGLAEKYDRLAARAGSKPKKQQFWHKAERYRRQAVEILRT